MSTAKLRLEQDESLDERNGLTVDNILKLLSLCQNAVFMTFIGQYYQQVHGTTMGSPVSVVVADMVKEHYNRLPWRPALQSPASGRGMLMIH